jgi:hypothetical protein
MGEACPLNKIKIQGRYAMTQSEKTNYRTSLMLKMLLFAALMVAGGVTSSTQAQELAKGTFTLSAETHFGSTRLPAGRYTVSVEPLASTTSPDFRVLVFVRPETKPGPVASVFALASNEACDTPSGLKLSSDGAGLAARSLCLAKQGLMIDFDLSRSSDASKIKAVASVRP